MDEEIVADGVRIGEGSTAADGSRPVRMHLDDGGMALRSAAAVAVDGAARVCPRDVGALPEPGDLDFDLLPWTPPSRYCPSGALGRRAEAVFGERPRTQSLASEVADRVHDCIACPSGTSDHLTTADETLVARRGVCRDMAHLGVSFLRAPEVPARAVAAYVPLRQSPDFHALLEAHDGAAPRLIDVTGLAAGVPVT